MSPIAYLKLIYALAGVSWFAFWTFRLVTMTAPDRNPNPLAFVACLFLFAAPPALGYVLLFKIVPWVGRRLRQLLSPA